MILVGGKPLKWLVLLAVLHGAIACAGFFAPYDPAQQDRGHAYIGPTMPHFFDGNGHFHLRPFFYDLSPIDTRTGFRTDPPRPIPVKFLVKGNSYRLLAFIPCNRHLLGADGGRLYLLGTDGYGRDQLSRILYGGQVSLLAGLLGAGITLLLAFVIGSVAGYYAGWRDGLLMRLAEVFLCLPWLYLLLGLRAFLPLDVDPLAAFRLVVVVIAIVGWARPARLVRGVVLSAKQRDFVRAARGFGASDAYLFRRHVFPAVLSVLLTQAALLIPQFVLAEMTLSFLGLGVPEPIASWGNLLANLQQYSVLASCWWMYLPALAIFPFFLGYLGLASTMQRGEASA